MKRILSWLTWQKIVLLVLLGLVVWNSFLTGNQWLLGWDSVIPELNWNLNIMRVFAGSWQEYQGLGLAGGMGHLADLSRIIILWLLSFVVPTHLVREVWHIGMLVIGPIGMWYLGKKIWNWNESSSLVGSVYYLLNFATIQYFFVPYESFSSFYGFLPWLIGIFLMYLEFGNKNDLLKLLLIGFISTSAFYVQTLFVVYIMVLGVLSLGYWKQWRRVILAFTIVLIVNSFWLLPLVYGVILTGKNVGLAKINSIASPETALMNAGFGDFKNVSLLRGYWLEYIEWIGGSQWGRLMQSWWDWSRQSWVEYVGMGLFMMSAVGSVYVLVKLKNGFGWIVGLLVTYMMIASYGQPFGSIYKLLVENVPLFGEMFRSGFTKWSVVLALFISIGLASLASIIKNKWLSMIFACMIVIGCIGTVLPVFQSGMIFEKMKVDLPSSYTNLFKFMENQPKSGRVVYLPAQSMWSWKYNDWGYRGSGFLWYGIQQPILDRAFDVWSPNNESFYNELSTALYGQDSKQLSQIINKYDLKYILLDESIVAPGQDNHILRFDETKKTAEEFGWTKVFNQDYLTVWDTGITNNQFISSPSNYVLVQDNNEKIRKDVIYSDEGTYVRSNQLGIDYPFTGLMQEHVDNISYSDTSMVIESDGLRGETGSELVVPGFKVGEIVRVEFRQGEAIPAYIVNGKNGPRFLGKEKPIDGENYIVARVREGEEWKEYLEVQSFPINEDKITFEVKGGAISYDFDKLGKKAIENCDILKRGIVEKSDNSYFADNRGSICNYLVMKEIDTRVSYLMRIKGDNKLGNSLKIFLYNVGSSRNDVEYLLDNGKFDQTFALLPWTWDSYYTLNIEVRSFGEKTEVEVDPVEIRWLPLNQIVRAKVLPLGTDEIEANESNLKIKEVNKLGTWLYRVKVEGSGLLTLSQGYDEGWVAPPIKHVKVDGWANGWLIGGSGEILIIYWPQLLEYLGFIVLATTLIIVWTKRE